MANHNNKCYNKLIMDIPELEMPAVYSFEPKPKPAQPNADWEREFGHHEWLRGAQYNREDFLHQFLQSELFLLDRANFTRQRGANSYRDFDVGAGVFALDETRRRVGYFFGANYHPEQGGTKVCAEQIATQKAIDAGYNYIVGIVVMGEPQMDGESHLLTPTLHPCGNCRRIFSNLTQTNPENERMMDEHTVIATAKDLEVGPFERHSLKELLYLHRPYEAPHRV